MRATTLHEIATANGVTLPRPAETLYQWKDFYGFLEVLRLGALAVKRREDFERVAYECIEDMHRHGNARHVEIFFNPHYYAPNGATYPLIVEGLAAGLERAERDFGVSSLMIACIDRSVCLPSEALQMLDWVAAHPHPRVVGVGLMAPSAAAIVAGSLAAPGGWGCSAPRMFARQPDVRRRPAQP